MTADDNWLRLEKYFVRQPSTGMARPGVLGGQEPPKNSLSPPSALEFLKIFVHCRHSRNLLVMLLESVVAF